MSTAKRIICAVLIAVVMVAFPIRAEALFMPPFGSGLPLTEVISTPVPIPDSKPRVIVENCTVGGGGLVSGAVCELRVTLRNVSTTMNVSSILVSGHWSNDSPPPVDFEETNQAYVSDIGPTQTRDVVFSLLTQSVNITALESVPLYLDIEYSYEGALDNTNSVIVRVPVSIGESDEYVPAEVIESGGQPADPGFDMKPLYLTGSVICAIAAVALIVLRIRRR